MLKITQNPIFHKANCGLEWGLHSSTEDEEMETSFILIKHAIPFTNTEIAHPGGLGTLQVNFK